MNLREKIAQMLLLGFDGQKLSLDNQIVSDLTEHAIGGVILFNDHAQSSRLPKNIDSPKQVQQLTSELNYLAKKHSQLPLFIAIDYEGGKVNRLDEAKGFPKTKSAHALGTLDENVVDVEASTMAQTLLQHGFNFNFAPVVDVNKNPDSPVIAKRERAFCYQPHRVTDIANTFRRQFINHKVLYSYKHFPGHGSSAEDSHQKAVDITGTWHKDELLPYEQLVKNPHALDTIMIGHLIHHNFDEQGLPATLSKKIVTDLLRSNLGYQGLVISDDLQMDAIKKHYSLKETLTLAINAGVDLLIFGNQLVETPITADEIISIIEALVRSGDINKRNIEEAFLRIQRAKDILHN